MKPAPFEYYVPTSVEEALDRLAQLGYDGKVLAGGQSLVPAMNFRLAQPAALVDLNEIKELFYIRPADDGGVSIGTMTRDTTVEFDPLIAERFPVIQEMMPHVGHLQNRYRGTFGGNVAHADPTGHLPAMVIALNGNLLVRNKDGERWIPSGEFIFGPFMSVLEPEDLLIEVAIPPLPPRSGAAYRQMSRQHGTAALAGVISIVTLDDGNKCQDARIVCLSVEEMPIVSQEAVKLLAGQSPGEALFREVAEVYATRDVTDPAADIHASADYRRQLVRTLTQRSLAVAFERAMGKGGQQ